MFVRYLGGGDDLFGVARVDDADGHYLVDAGVCAVEYAGEVVKVGFDAGVFEGGGELGGHGFVEGWGKRCNALPKCVAPCYVYKFSK